MRGVGGSWCGCGASMPSSIPRAFISSGLRTVQTSLIVSASASASAACIVGESVKCVYTGTRSQRPGTGNGRQRPGNCDSTRSRLYLFTRTKL